MKKIRRFHNLWWTVWRDKDRCTWITGKGGTRHIVWIHIGPVRSHDDIPGFEIVVFHYGLTLGWPKKQPPTPE